MEQLPHALAMQGVLLLPLEGSTPPTKCIGVSASSGEPSYCPMHIVVVLQSLYSCVTGETARLSGADGATAPETLRQKDRDARKLWRAAPRAPTEGEPPP